jgi:hypothetical protein
MRNNEERRETGRSDEERAATAMDDVRDGDGGDEKRK